MLKLVKRRALLDEQQTMEYALRLLGARMLSVRELERKLLKRSGEEAVFRVIDRLLEWGYLDDAAYAEAFVRSHRNRWGELRIRSELRRRGVADELIERALEQQPPAGDAALALLRKHAWRHKGERARMVRFLQGRGFTLGEALRAAEEYGKLREDEENG